MTKPLTPGETRERNTIWAPIESVRQLDKITAFRATESPFGRVTRGTVVAQLIALAYAQLPKEAQ